LWFYCRQLYPTPRGFVRYALHTRRWETVGSTLDQWQMRWPEIEPTLSRILVYMYRGNHGSCWFSAGPITDALARY